MAQALHPSTSSGIETPAFRLPHKLWTQGGIIGYEKYFKNLFYTKSKKKKAKT
jgi:hypothetical protein